MDPRTWRLQVKVLLHAGGQKKRVTLGEQCVGPRNVFLLDEISTGAL